MPNDAERDEVAELRAEIDRLEALFQQTHGVHHGWVLEVDRLRGELASVREERDAWEAQAMGLHDGIGGGLVEHRTTCERLTRVKVMADDVAALWREKEPGSAVWRAQMNESLGRLVRTIDDVDARPSVQRSFARALSEAAGAPSIGDGDAE